MLVPIHHGEAQGVHGDDRHFAGPAERCELCLVRRDLQDLQGPHHFGQAEILRETAVEDVDIRTGRIRVGL